MRKPLITLFCVGLLGSLLMASCVKKETNGGGNTGGSSNEAGAAGNGVPLGENGGAGSTNGGDGGANTTSEANKRDACEDLEIISDDGKACGSTSMSATYNNIHMLIVLDKSKSMDQTPEGFGKSKWAAIQEALNSALSASSKQVRFGLIMYPYVASGKALCGIPTGKDAVNVEVDVAKTSVPLIIDALADSAPDGGTPTTAALAAAYEYYVDGLGASLPKGDRYVLLATDGGPNCNAASGSCSADVCTYNLDNQCDSSGSCCQTGIPNGTLGCLDSDGVRTQIAALKKAGIKTFVVGIPGSEAYKPLLTQFAEAGDAIDPNGGELKYYAVSADNGVEGLTATFKSITESLVRDCDVKLAEKPVNSLKLNVAVECKLLPRGDAALPESEMNWVYNNDDKNPVITIQGNMCNTIKTQGVTRVDVIEGCTTRDLL